MKNITLLSLIVFLFSSPLMAQDPSKFYLLPNVQLVPKTGQTAIALGTDAAYSPVSRFFVGLSYQQVINTFMPLTEDDVRKELTSRWGGLKFDYLAMNNEQFKVYTNLGTGRGEVDIIIREDGALPDESVSYNYLQLGVNFDLVLSSSFSLSLGWQYRFVSEINYKNVTAQDIGGLGGQFGLRYLINR